RPTLFPYTTLFRSQRLISCRALVPLVLLHLLLQRESHSLLRLLTRGRPAQASARRSVCRNDCIVEAEIKPVNETRRIPPLSRRSMAGGQTGLCRSDVLMRVAI